MPIRRLAVAAVAAALAAGVQAAPATAATCESSALRGTVLGQVIEPVVAGRGAGSCTTSAKTLADTGSLPLPIAVSGLSAVTAGDEPRALAAGGIASLEIRALPELPIRLPVPELSAALGAVEVPLPGLLGLPSKLTLDLRPALQALLPDGRLPNADLVSLGAVSAWAAGDCTKLRSGSSVAGLQLLGRDTPLNAVVEQALTLVDTGKIDPSAIDLAKVTLPLGLSFADPLLGPILQGAVQPVLDALPDIALPAQLASVKITPGQELASADRVVRRALRVQVAVAGRSLADLVIGEAVVTRSACAGDPPTSPADLALSCTTRKVVLTDVVRRGDRVQLLGAAHRSFVGKRVKIVREWDGETVASPVVARDGTFESSAPLPPRAIRATNEARYRASIGKERSLGLKLARRMLVSSMRSAKGKVTIKGRITGPRGGRRPIEVRERVDCKRWRLVGSAIPREDGRFTAVVDAPEGRTAAVYRLATKVPNSRTNPKLFPTFTLPRAVNL